MKLKPASTLGLAAWSLLSAPPPCLSFPVAPRWASPRGRQRSPSPSPFDHHPSVGDPLGGFRLRSAPASADDGPARARRRRRRRKGSAVVPSGNVDEGSDFVQVQGDIGGEESAADLAGAPTTPATTETTIVDPTATSKCPLFSMAFPRYRIDLSSDFKDDESERRRLRRARRGSLTKLVEPNNKTRTRIRKNDDESPWGMVGGVFKGMLSSRAGMPLDLGSARRARESVESLYREEIKEGSFRWSPSSAGDDGKGPCQDEDFTAAAAFWRTASDIVVSEGVHERWHLALPETTPSVARNLCDILNWYADLLEKRDEGQGGAKATKVVRAELDSRSDVVPVVRFAVVATNNNLQLERRRQFLKEMLPTTDDTERRTKAWVKRLLVQLGICPFTKSAVKSGQGLGDLGVPVANIMYRHSDALGEDGGDMYLLMSDAWEAMSDMVAAGPSGRSGVSSILLSAPGFDDDFALWAGPVFAMLETCVGAIQAEGMVGVVCFHPQYVTPDGTSWPGFGHMHSVPRLRQWYNHPDASSLSSSSPNPPLSDNEIAAGGAWQRRTPHAVINVLRAEQLEAAEGRRRSGQLYERNIRVLVGKEDGVSVGLDRLAEDLKREQCL